MPASIRLLLGYLFMLIDVGAFYLTYQLIDRLQAIYPNVGLRFLDFHNIWINGFIWVLVASLLGVYRSFVRHDWDVHLRQTWRALIYQQVIVAFILYLNLGSFFIEQVFLIKIALLFFFVFFNRFLFIRLDIWLESKSNYFNRIGIFGLNQTSIRLASKFEMKYHGNKFVGIINEDDVLRFGYDQVDPTGQLLNALYYAKQDNIRELYVCFPSQLLPDINYLFAEAEKQFIRLKIIPSTADSRLHDLPTQSDFGFQFASYRKVPLDNLINRIVKRTFDVVFSLFVIIFILSWLYPILAILIKFQSPGPVIFKQLRTGRSNEVFWCYKFRSMRVNSERDSRQATKNDDRLTPIGRFIRQTSLDEFPQFWNVLMGNMSVVGPRPHMIYHTNSYQKLAEGFAFRHFVKPGITGLAQVRGFRGEITGIDVLQARIGKDIAYIESWNLIQDIKICFYTVYFLLKGDPHAF
jgi:putative colanic acid biosynthesis UDP-glucose lipid carrier transferase